MFDRPKTGMTLRFTSDWPPPSLWSRYPNWTFAYDEEDRPGQDETTLKPASEQDRISEEVDYTAAEAEQSNGVKLPALIEMITGKAWGVQVFGVEARWSVQLLGTPGEWKCETGMSFGDRSVFPLTVRSRLSSANGQRVVLEIDGEVQ